MSDARLRIYIGAAPGVGKTYRMLRDAHQLRAEGVVIFGQTQRSRLELLLKGSVVDRFLREVPDAAVQVVPGGEETS